MRTAIALALVASACAAAPPETGPSVPPPVAGATPLPAASSDPLGIGELHRARCGKCHARVEPGARSRAELTVALARHRARVHLTDAQWSALVDYLAPTEAATGRHG